MVIGKGDPRRPLFLAVNAARVLGVLSLLFVALIAIVLIVLSHAQREVPSVPLERDATGAKNVQPLPPPMQIGPD